MIPVEWQRFMWLIGGADAVFVGWWAIHVSQSLRDAREELSRCQNKYWLDYAAEELDRKSDRLEELEEENYKLQMEVSRLTAQQEQNVQTVSDYRQTIEQKKMNAPMQKKDENGHFQSEDGMSGKQKYFYAAIMKKAGISKDVIAHTLGISEQNVASYASRARMQVMAYSEDECVRLADSLMNKDDITALSDTERT